MLRNQDITVPYDDTRRVEWDIDDVVRGEEIGPSNLLGKGARWDLYRDNRSTTPMYALISDGDKLVISEPDGGIVSLYLNSAETTLDIDSGRYYLRITEGEDQWTVATGKYTIVR